MKSHKLTVEEQIKTAKLKVLDDIRTAVITRQMEITTYPTEAKEYTVAEIQGLKIAVLKMAGNEILKLLAEKVREVSIVPTNLPAGLPVKFLATYKKKVRRGKK